MVAFTWDAIASPPPPTLFELQQIAAGDQQSCRNLIERWETPIRVIASRYASRRSDLDDLMQAVRLGMHLAALHYNQSGEAPFAHYAKRAIKNRVMQEVARLARQRWSQSSLDGDACGSNAQPKTLQHTEHLTPVKQWIRDLPEPHATVFRLLYIERVKQREAGRHWGSASLGWPRCTSRFSTSLGSPSQTSAVAHNAVELVGESPVAGIDYLPT